MTDDDLIWTLRLSAITAWQPPEWANDSSVRTVQDERNRAEQRQSKILHSNKAYCLERQTDCSMPGRFKWKWSDRLGRAIPNNNTAVYCAHAKQCDSVIENITSNHTLYWQENLQTLQASLKFSDLYDTWQLEYVICKLLTCVCVCVCLCASYVLDKN